MARLLKFIGSSDVLGEIARECKYYYLVYPYTEGSKGKYYFDYSRVVAHSKWNTTIINDTEGLQA